MSLLFLPKNTNWEFLAKFFQEISNKMITNIYSFNKHLYDFTSRKTLLASKDTMVGKTQCLPLPFIRGDWFSSIFHANIKFQTISDKKKLSSIF